MRLAFTEGQQVWYESGSSAVPSGQATVLDVMADGDRTEPAYIVHMHGARFIVAESDLQAVGGTSGEASR